MQDAFNKRDGFVTHAAQDGTGHFEAAVQLETQSIDRQRYVADMILELKQIAERDGYSTLAGILALAHAEASIKRN